MGTFFLSYWWIIILVGIAIVLIFKSLIKIITALGILLLGFILIWEMGIAPGITKIELCFTEASQQINATYYQDQLKKTPDERNQYLCSENLASYDRLKTCLNAARDQSTLSFEIYSHFQKFNDSIDEIVKNNNKMCPSSPLQKFVFSK